MSDHVPPRAPIDRRTFLTGLGTTGTGLALASQLRGRPAAAQPADFQLRAAEPNPKAGGTLRFGVHNAPAHFDIHQSGTVGNIGPQGPMYDCLVRRDPRDGQTIIPDLAQRWEISPDGRLYTFHIRRGV